MEKQTNFRKELSKTLTILRFKTDFPSSFNFPASVGSVVLPDKMNHIIYDLFVDIIFISFPASII